MLFQKQLHALGRRIRTTTDSAERFKAIQAPMTVAAGALLGVLTGVPAERPPRGRAARATDNDEQGRQYAPRCGEPQMETPPLLPRAAKAARDEGPIIEEDHQGR